MFLVVGLGNPGKDYENTNKKPKPNIMFDLGFSWRRGRDSNPRVVSHKLISSQPRYDRFDTSAYMMQ